jgi:hypothetical protein
MIAVRIAIHGVVVIEAISIFGFRPVAYPSPAYVVLEVHLVGRTGLFLRR